MRFVDLDKFEKAYSGLEEFKYIISKLDEATKCVDELDSVKKKNEYFKLHSYWSEFGKLLKKYCGQRCWYSDNVQASDLDIDHFRPKGSAKKECGKEFSRDTEDGYWWLAYDWKNFRVAGKWQNQKRTQEETAGGKGDLFPLLDYSKTFQLNDDISKEPYLLLDPTVKEDVEIISFNSVGDICSLSETEEDKKRVEISRIVYHLHNQTLMDKRKKKWNEVSNLIEYINDDLNDNKLDRAKKKIGKMIKLCKINIVDDDGKVFANDLSSVAIACLINSGEEWALDIVKNELAERY